MVTSSYESSTVLEGASTRASRPSGWVKRSGPITPSHRWLGRSPPATRRVPPKPRSARGERTPARSALYEVARDHARCGLETLLRREIENVLAVFIEHFKWYAKDDDSSWRSLVRMAAGSALAELGRYDEAQTTLREARDIASRTRNKMLERAALMVEADIADRAGGGYRWSASPRRFA